MRRGGGERMRGGGVAVEKEENAIDGTKKSGFLFSLFLSAASSVAEFLVE